MLSDFKESYLKLTGITEVECYSALSYNELVKLIRYFQFEKRSNFHLFMECLQKQVEQGSEWLEGDQVDKAKIKHWKNHLHYESLVEWCFRETTRRTGKRKGKKGK